MTTLTIALIVKNEAANLTDCLASCSGLADQIVVVDSGSTDDTVAIAEQFGAKVVVHTLWQGFGPQRQVAQSHVTGDWVLWLDADERLTPTLKVAIREAITLDDRQCLYQVSRLSWVFGRFIRHSGWYPDRVVRLYATTKTSYTEAPVHEQVMVPTGFAVKTLDGDLLHYTYRDLQHYLVKSAQYADLWASDRKHRGKTASLTQGSLHALGCFFKMYLLKTGFLDGKQGLLLALLSAHSTFAKYADLWIRDQPQPKS